MIKRLRKKLDCTPSHGLNAHPGISMSSNKKNGDVAVLFFQLLRQLQTRHLRHADINDQAAGLTMQVGFEELFRGPETLCGKSCGLQQVTQGILHGLVVIDDRSQFGSLVRRHAPEGSPKANPGAIELSVG